MNCTETKDPLKKMKDYIKEEYSCDDLANIMQNGCVNGPASAHIYYADTCAFYDAYEGEIDELVNRYASELGLSPLEFVASLNGAKDVTCEDQRKNLLCWFAIEECAREVIEKED